MKVNVKKMTSVLLAVLMVFSMCAVFSVSAADAQDSVGAGLTVTTRSNYCTGSASQTVAKGGTVTVKFASPEALQMVNIQWGMNYDKTKLQLVGYTAFTSDMMINPNASGFSVRGSAASDSNPYSVSAGTNVMSFSFKALEEGAAEIYFYMEDLTKRTAAGDEAVVVDGVPATGPSLTVKANSNFFASQTQVFDNVTKRADADGNMYVTVEYKLYAKDMYIINIDVPALTYDPTVLEWKAEYNSYNNMVDFFPFAVEHGFGTGSVQNLPQAGTLTGNYVSVKPAANAFDGTNPVTVVKATFKVLDRNAGTTTVNCTVDTLSFCDNSESYPYMKYIAIDKTVVNSANKAKATYSTAITATESQGVLIGDVDKDGSITINDATMLQRYLCEFDVSINLAVADTNNDGKINVLDVTEIQRYCAEYITSFR